jgi:hypothetical protein
MSARFPWPDVTLLGLAGGSLLAGLLLPPSPSLDPVWLPWWQRLSALWTLGCGWRLERRLRQRQAWWHSPTWLLPPEALAGMAQRPWYRRWFRPPPPQGVLLGSAFPWHAGHTQTLEMALATDKALPTATASRGGHPALHAVGQAEEVPLVLPWSELVGQVGVTGTTRSGKTRLLEVIAEEVIRGS